MRPPRPSAALSRPTPLSPNPRSSIEETTISVRSSPRTKVCTTKSPATSVAPGSGGQLEVRRRSGSPWLGLRQPHPAHPLRARNGCRHRRGRPRERHGDEQTRGDRAGPGNYYAGEEWADERPDALAYARRDVRSNQFSRRPGERGEQCGLDRADERARARDDAASTYTNSIGTWVPITTAVSTAPAQRTTLIAVRTRSPRYRSTSIGANGAVRIAGTIRTAPRIPTASVPLASYTKTSRTTRNAQSAAVPVVHDSSIRLIDGFRMTSRSAAAAGTRVRIGQRF